MKSLEISKKTEKEIVKLIAEYKKKLCIDKISVASQKKDSLNRKQTRKIVARLKGRLNRLQEEVAQTE